MGRTSGETRRFVQAVAAILLATCSLFYVVGGDAAVTASKQHVAPAANPIFGVIDEHVDGGEATGRESPESLLKRGITLLEEGSSREAVEVLDAAVAGWEEKLGSTELTSIAAALTAHRLGEALALKGEYARSAEVYARALRANQALLGRESSGALESMVGLGLALRRAGSHAKAAKALGITLEARMLNSNKGLGMDVKGVTENLDGLVKALVHPPLAEGESGGGGGGGGDSEGEGDNEGEGEMGGALAAVDHINRVAWRYFLQHAPHDGETVMKEALRLFREEREEEAGPGTSPPGDIVVSAYLFNLGFLRLAVLGQYKSAADVLQQAHALRAPLLGDEHTLTVQAVVSRAWALVLTGDVRLAADELTRSAKALLSAGQATAAEQLLRQALQGSREPLGIATYAHACFTQHVNMLKSWGTEGEKELNKFVSVQIAIGKKAALSENHPSVVLARTTLVTALMEQLKEEDNESDLLQLSTADVDQLWEEVAAKKKN